MISDLLIHVETLPPIDWSSAAALDREMPSDWWMRRTCWKRTTCARATGCFGEGEVDLKKNPKVLEELNCQKFSWSFGTISDGIIFRFFPNANSEISECKTSKILDKTKFQCSLDFYHIVVCWHIKCKIGIKSNFISQFPIHCWNHDSFHILILIYLKLKILWPNSKITTAKCPRLFSKQFRVTLLNSKFYSI